MEEGFVVLTIDGAVGESGGAEDVLHCAWVLSGNFTDRETGSCVTRLIESMQVFKTPCIGICRCYKPNY